MSDSFETAVITGACRGFERCERPLSQLEQSAKLRPAAHRHPPPGAEDTTGAPCGSNQDPVAAGQRGWCVSAWGGVRC